MESVQFTVQDDLLHMKSIISLLSSLGRKDGDYNNKLFFCKDDLIQNRLFLERGKHIIMYCVL